MRHHRTMPLRSNMVGTALFASGAATAVTARIAGGTFAIGHPNTLVAPPGTHHRCAPFNIGRSAFGVRCSAFSLLTLSPISHLLSSISHFPYFPALQPPSIIIVLPVTMALSSAAR